MRTIHKPLAMKKSYKSFKRLHMVDFPVWHYTVYVVFTDDYNAASKELNLEQPARPFGPTTEAVTFHEDGNGISYMFFHKKEHVSIKSIVHESWHVIHRMLEYVGAEVDNETVAYHLGYLVEKVLLAGTKK